MRKIQDIPISDRPREKLLTKGASSLSDRELLAVILGSGSSAYGVTDLSTNVLKVVDSKNGGLTPEALIEIPGIGRAKSTLICAAIEFARRRIRPEGTKVREACDVFPLIRHFAEQKQEHFLCLSLNGAHEVIATRVVTIGLLNSSQVHPREVFSDPIKDRAASIIVAHNHPSGQLTESQEDLRITKILVEAGKLLGIKVLDHLIFCRTGYLSLSEKGLI